jgi:APA family basic amino acid/polyamine antiporter
VPEPTPDGTPACSTPRASHGASAPQPGHRRPEGPGLRRTLGLWQVSLTGVGVILGAGVYALIGPAATLAGRMLWLAFAFAGLAAAFTAYSYARLGAMRPKASPEFQYTALAFGPKVGFLAGWLMLVGDIAAAASVALGFGGYLQHVLGVGTVLGAGALVLVAGVLMYAGIGQSIGIAAALTAVEAAGLLLVVAVGAPAWPRLDFTMSGEGLAGVAGAAALIFFAYLGFDELGNLAEEMRAPERDLPRALFISLGVTTLVYMAVAVSAVAVVPADALGRSSAPLALVVGTALGPGADLTLTLMALAATANTVLLLLVSAARSVYGMAEAGVLPRALARLTRTRVPREGMIAVFAATLALIATGDLSRVAHLTDAVVLVSFACVNLALVTLAARRRTAGGRAGRARDVAIAGAGAAMCAALLWYGGVVWIAATVLIAAIGAAWLLVRRGGARPAAA